MYAIPLLALALATTAAGPGTGEYARTLDAGKLDQAALDAEGYGEKKALKREDDGLRVVLDSGAAETGWKTPQALRFGGDFTIAADFVVKSLPKPATEDGVAVGLAIAFNSIDQPDATFIRVVEPGGPSVYRTLEKAAVGDDPQQAMMRNRMIIQNGMGMMVVMGGGMPAPGAKPTPPPRRTFPAEGESFRLELSREGQTLRYRVVDAKSSEPRYLGQITLQPQDVAAVKLFATNRNGAGPADVLFKNLSIRADRITGLGTAVRTVFDEVVYGDPTAIEDGKLIIGSAASGAPGAANVTPTPTTVPPAMVAAQARPVRGGQVGAVVVAPAGVVVPAVALAPARVAQAAPAQAGPAAAASTPAPAPAAGGALPDDVFAPAGGADPPPPKARIPMNEVEGVRFERQPTLAARFLGQPNIDLTQGAPTPEQAAEAAKKPDAAKKPEPADEATIPPPGTTIVKPPPKVEAKKNGIRDIQIGLSGLRPAKLQQVMVNCQTDQGATTWQLDAAGGAGWPIVLRRSATDPTADLFLEPPPGDCHQKSFTINVNYEDGQAASVNFQADGHSDAKLAFDEKAEAAETPDAWVHLDGDEKLFGAFEGVADDVLRLKTPWKDELKIPLSRIAGVHVSLSERKETPESFARRLKARGTEDLLLARSKNGEVVPIAGILEAVEDGRLRFLYQGKSRSLPLKQVEGVVLAARPAKPVDGLRSTFLLVGGAAVSGSWKAIDPAAWKVESPWGQELKLPPADVQEVRFRGGKMTYLSDLEPSRVEETPYFGRRSPWRRDASLSGGKIKMAGRTHGRGVAVHSRCVLTYDLEGRYETFEALVGFDDEARGKGRVACRVLADDRELYAEPDLRADAPAVPLKLRVAGASQLKLVVDFGAGQDAGDRVIWADARLFRADVPTTAANDPRDDR
ncbi:NPCBM/NEW2 domain-containing protein [Planctomyces sp. SH-PL62]|uniref:NPCBM/NEW2 domain-containing protein n=1 Tax=Planctomyces sp. SH-PL62 TaxID=1636152 RepID=UPI00078C3E65|nr:NPCBM/NEW2 domain-containing protein [Planctomyces sp. SH-PL62]AMV40997.1 NPCBM/NEW2 domain protein [Planctomyces sp. SH-PL62]